MPIQLVHGDITTLHCDVIVNPTDPVFSGSGGVDRAIHRAAGPGLDEACRKLPPIDPGEVCVTPGFDLCPKIIHTVGPVWQGGTKNETTLLRACYTNALMLAVREGASSIAFPLISSGTFGFPRDRVLTIAQQAIADFLFTVENEPNVYICIYDKSSYELRNRGALERYLEKNTVFTMPEGGTYYFCPANPFGDEEEEALPPVLPEAKTSASIGSSRRETSYKSSRPPRKAQRGASKLVDKSPRVSLSEDICESCISSFVPGMTLEEYIKQMDAPFVRMLDELIKRKGMTDAECYHKANVSRQTFSKIHGRKSYTPTKATVVQFAIALELTLEETNALLETLGMTLSNSSLFDVIVRFFIESGNYDIFELNNCLFDYDQPTLIGLA